MYYVGIITYFRNNYKYVSNKIITKKGSSLLSPTATPASLRLLLLTSIIREKKKKNKKFTLC